MQIIEEANVKVEDGALKIISKYAKGALRDAISLLDQCLATANDKLMVSDILLMAGLFDEDIFFEMLMAVKGKNIEKIIEIIDNLYSKGRDLYFFLQGFIEFLRDILIYIITGLIDNV